MEQQANTADDMKSNQQKWKTKEIWTMLSYDFVWFLCFIELRVNVYFNLLLDAFEKMDLLVSYKSLKTVYV